MINCPPRHRITKGIHGGLTPLHFVKLPYRATSDTLIPLYDILLGEDTIQKILNFKK